ncbi:SAM-dependent methyltransferase [Rhizobium leguminosarum]|uniref:Eco57I restriction-modification methylase domain-containing protein n=1 Tax=Rhizobium leguminosarum TaxID=384 RepID=UPI003F9D701F
MASLGRKLRKDLETTVKQARRIAEGGARRAVEQIGVGEAEAPKHLTVGQREQRNRLRAHGRQLGDRRDPKGVQATLRLVQECAYEQWHRMLFARFLAETELLIEPESGMAISLDEVQELAREKATDWLPLASDYAERMLPQIFRKDDPVLDIALPPETRSAMEDLLKGLTKPVFEADDGLGWVYQFWQSDKKDEVNKSEVKIGADELPAVTQLFTEDYMVLFLLHNTLGAWWAGKVLAGNPSLATSAPDEGALRAACKVGDVDWTYLRFVRDTAEDRTEGPWRPAAGVFEGWPGVAKDLTLLDPCMGSGHFLVFALPILVAFRMAEEGLLQSDAVDAVLKDNLFGLEIDPRCTQIAAFNLAFAAWRKVGYRPLPQLNLACSGLAIGVSKAEWLKLAEKAVTAADPAAKRDLLGAEKNLLTMGLEERVKNGLEALYDLFAKAPWLGSLIDPRRAGGDIFREGFDKLEPLLASILSAADSDDAREMAVAAQGMAKAAELLSRHFILIATNVPYLGRGKQDEELKEFIDNEYSDAKSDIAVAFLLRMHKLSAVGGSISQVSPQSWLYLGPYKSARVKLLKGLSWDFLCPLGTRAFETITGEIVNVSLSAATKSSWADEHEICVVDVSHQAEPAAKALGLLDRDTLRIKQSDQLRNPDSRFRISERGDLPLLSQYANSYKGIATGDLNRFIGKFWEFPLEQERWAPLQVSVSENVVFGGRSEAILWDSGNGELLDFVTEKLGDGKTGAWIRGKEAWGRQGIAVSQMSSLSTSLYSGDLFDENTAAIIPKDDTDLLAIFVFCRSNEFRSEVKKIDGSSLKIPNLTMLKVPFEIDRWRLVADEYFKDGFPKAESNDVTQWLFSGHPGRADRALVAAICRLAGFSWARQLDCTINGCDPIGNDVLEEHCDADGIVCLTALKGEPPAEQRLNALLADAFGADWSAAKLAGFLTDVGFAGKSLDDWLRDGFFAQHCELFQQRPFIWHIWDGRRDGFHALVNYHRLAAPKGEGRRTLEKLIYSYLGDWIDRQRADQTAGVEGADARLAHAEHLKAELIKILEGEPPYDIFVRWKPVHEQSIGWDPDINDGVRMNIRPFMTAGTLNARGGKACILRTAPKIKWDKDRGKEPPRDKADYPWFWGWDEATIDFIGAAAFDGNRWNDLHFSRAVKQAARDRYEAKSGGKP